MKRSQIKRRPLADTVLSTLEPEDKDYRELDGNGLYFRVRKNGLKGWNLRYKKPDGKWTWLGLGGFPTVSGKAARRRAAELRGLADAGIDISRYKEGQNATSAHTFRDSAEAYYQQNKDAGYAVSTLKKLRLYLDKDILPVLGDKDITKITRSDCIRLQESIEARSALNVSNKVRYWVNTIFSQAIARGLCEMNPASEMKSVAVKAPPVTNYPHLLEPELPALMRDIERSNSRRSTVTAIKMVLMTMARPGMVRNAEWSEIDLEAGTWYIKNGKMKMRREFVVPLPRQLIELLRVQRESTGRNRYVFPGTGHKNSMMSDNTINKALGNIGYKDRLVGHGARHTASTLLREHRWEKDYVEAQLAHVEPGTAGVYNKAAYFTQRAVMMQWYADYLHALRAGITDEEKRVFKRLVNVVH